MVTGSDYYKRNQSENRPNSALLPMKRQLSQMSDGLQTYREESLRKLIQSIEGTDHGSKAARLKIEQFLDICKTYQNMFAFDWDLREIMTSRHSPSDELTAGAFWFYVNITFFP